MTEIRRVVIVGNGFDLSLGFKTSFRNYLDSKEFRSISDSNTLARFIRSKQRKEENWCDLEGAFPEWIESLSNKRDGRYAIMGGAVNTQIQSPEEEYDELNESIHKFLRNIIPHRYKNDYRIGVLMSHWGKSSTLTVFNFNYTDTFSHYAELVPRGGFTEDYRHYHVHGTLEKGIVVGSDRDSRIGEKRFILKSTSPNYEPPPSFYSELELASHIDIYGHSLGNSDRSYFEGIFSKLLNDSSYNPIVRIFTKDRESSRSVRSQASSFIDDRLVDVQSRKKLRFIQVEVLSDYDFNTELSAEQ